MVRRVVLEDGHARHDQTDKSDQHGDPCRLLQPPISALSRSHVDRRGLKYSVPGQRAAIVRHINRLWSIMTRVDLSVLIGLFLAKIIWTAAPFAAVYFKPRRCSLSLDPCLPHGALGVREYRRRSIFNAGCGVNKTYRSSLSKADLVLGSRSSPHCPADYWALVIGIMIEEIAAVI